jgi:thiol:disulfide interchange protein DsbD
MRVLLASLIWVFAGSIAFAEPVKTEYATAELVSDRQIVTAGDQFHLGLELKLRDHWHSYWINPGDAGLATEIKWDLPEGVMAGEIKWPVPKAITLGELVNYGYEGKTLYPIPFVIAPDFVADGPLQLKAHATWLVCEDICVPEQADLVFTLNQRGGSENTEQAKRVASALASLPETVSEQDLKAGYTLQGDKIRFHFAGPVATKAATASQVWFYPQDTGAVKHADRQRIQKGENGFTIWSEGGFRAKRGTLKDTDGILVLGKGKSAKGWTVSLRANDPLEGTAADKPDPALQRANSEAGSSAPAKPAGGLFTALLFAFIGGVLLNLMPCVFPVLSMKVMGFVSAAHEEAAIIRKHGILFLIGVLVSFLILGGLLIALKAGGQQIGWGFQLQYAPFVAFVAVLFFVLGLNLLGVFQMGGRLMGVGGSLTDKGGNAGAFFTGVLAVVVASPCTAPAMGWALGYTLTQSAPVSMMVFLALGLGFAAPFTLLSLRPGLLRFLPKPGAWMERFHQLMAFPMFGAAIWLVWVVGSLSGTVAIAAMLIAFLLIGFSFWAWKGKRIGKFSAVVAAIAAVFMVSNALADRDVSALQPQEWSLARVAELRAEGRIVFVDFTADWCVTCQFNKRTALSGKRVAAAFAKENAVFLTADWTRRNDEIAAELARHGRAGVPLYLVYKPGQDEPDVLPQMLTPQIVERALQSSR